MFDFRIFKNIFLKNVHMKILIIFISHYLGKQIHQLKWFAVYDLTEYEAYGSLFIPEGFEPPDTQVLSHLEGKANGIEADKVLVMDSKTIMLEKFYYDGKGGNGIHFYAGRGPQPSSKGSVVPNELGYFEPLRR